MLSFVILIIGNALCTEKTNKKSNQKAMISSSVPFYESYTIIENRNLKKRTIDEIQKKFKQSFVRPLSACKNPKECKSKFHGKQNILPSIEDHANSLKIVNFIRDLAGLSKGVIEDEEWSEECYKTAINMQKIKKSKIQLIRNNELFITENSMTVFNSLVKLITNENVENQVSLFHPNLKKIGFGFYPFREEKIDGFISLKPSITVIKFSTNYLEEKIILPSNLKFVSWPPEGPFPIEFLQSNWHIRHDDFKKTQINEIEIFIHRDDGIELKAENISIDADLLIFQVSKNDLNKCQIMRTITVTIINQQTKKIYRFSFELFKADRNAYFHLNTEEKNTKNKYLLNSYAIQNSNKLEEIKRKSNEDENLFKFLFNSFFMFIAAVLLFIFLGAKNSENEDSEEEKENEKENENIENVENENEKNNNSSAENGGNFNNSGQPVVDPITCCYCNLCCLHFDRACNCCNNCDCKLDCGDCDCNIDDCDCNFCDVCNIFL